MRLFKIAVMILVAGMTVPTTKAQSMDLTLQDWEALPEKPGMREICSNDLRWAIAITNLRNQNASVMTLLEWAEQEANHYADDATRTPVHSGELGTKEVTKIDRTNRLLPLGIMLSLIPLIQQSLFSPSIYQQIKGGFPQYAYRSCLKGKPIDQ